MIFLLYLFIFCSFGLVLQQQFVQYCSIIVIQQFARQFKCQQNYQCKEPNGSVEVSLKDFPKKKMSIEQSHLFFLKILTEIFSLALLKSVEKLKNGSYKQLFHCQLNKICQMGNEGGIGRNVRIIKYSNMFTFISFVISICLLCV